MARRLGIIAVMWVAAVLLLSSTGPAVFGQTTTVTVTSTSISTSTSTLTLATTRTTTLTSVQNSNASTLEVLTAAVVGASVALVGAIFVIVMRLRTKRVQPT